MASSVIGDTLTEEEKKALWDRLETHYQDNDTFKNASLEKRVLWLQHDFNWMVKLGIDANTMSKYNIVKAMIDSRTAHMEKHKSVHEKMSRVGDIASILVGVALIVSSAMKFMKKRDS